MNENSQKLILTPKYLEIVMQGLKTFNYDVFAFGSRTKSTTKKFSDLDLLIKGEPTKKELIALKHYFEDSNLPFKVDIVLFGDLEKTFYEQIKLDLTLIKKKNPKL
jgi:predicted nucleotidyltransferase